MNEVRREIKPQNSEIPRVPGDNPRVRRLGSDDLGEGINRMEAREIPEDLIEAAVKFRDVALSHGYNMIACALHPATDEACAGSVSSYHATLSTFRHMAEQVLAGINAGLKYPVTLDDEWIPFEMIGKNIKGDGSFDMNTISQRVERSE